MAITVETSKTCIDCGETKSLENFDFVSSERSRRYARCSACLLSSQPAAHRTWAVVAGPALLVENAETDIVPPSSFGSELEVVDACWSNCVEVGAPGIRRIFDRLDMAAADLGGNPESRQKIRDLVRDYRSGSVPLKQAQRVVKAVLSGLQG